MEKSKKFSALFAPILLLIAACCVLFNMPSTVLAESENPELKKFNVVFENYPEPSYLKYGPDIYDERKDFFVIEDDDLIVSRTPSSDGRNNYTYKPNVIYSVFPCSVNDAGESYDDWYFNKGKNYYDVKISISDHYKKYETYEIYLKNYYIVVDEQAMQVPTFTTTYNGSKQIATLPSDAKYTAEVNDGGIDVGTYSVTLKSKNIDIFFWDGVDRTQKSVTTTFEITKETNNHITDLKITPWTYGNYDININNPTANNTIGNIEYTYYDSNNLVVADISNAKPGIYTLQAKIEETDNYNGDIQSITFEISKQNVIKPSEDTSTFEYDGTAKIYTLQESSYYTISGNIKTNAGTYIVYVDLIDTDIMQWDDGSVDRLQYIFKIDKQSVNPPVVNDKEYSGSRLTADVAETYLYRVV